MERLQKEEDTMAQISNAAAIGSTGAKPGLLPSRAMLKRTIAGLALLSGIAVATAYGYQYWTVGRFLESTDDAYVKADYTTIAPKVSGYIADVLVEDNEPVKAGQLLARIDDRDFRTALDQAKADVATTEAAIRNLDAQIVLQNSVIDQQKADIAATEATLKFAREDNERYQHLMMTGYGTVQRAQQTDAALRENVAQVDRAHAGLAAAQNKVEVLSTERTKAVAQRDHARAVEHQAELNLSYTTISAPIDGTVGARSLRVGQYVEAGTQLMAVVPLSAAYIVANFKETQLAHVRGGEPVEVEVDGYSSVTLTGHVDSLSPASGLEFALLPPDNATGNFTKIVQRIPVKIVLDGSALTGRLRPGMSVEPVINTKATVLAERQQKAAVNALGGGEPKAGQKAAGYSVSEE
jgi:membrane fusion protein, multidrug efflux system